MLAPSLSLRGHAHGLLVEHLMRIAHKSGNTSGVSKSSSDWLNYTGFLGDVCVAFFNVLPGNKDAVMLNPLTKEDSRRVYTLTVTTSAYQDHINAGFSKVCEIFKVYGIESLKWVQELYSPVCYCGNISKPLNMTRHKTKRDWLLYLSVIWPFGRDLAVQSAQGSQTFFHQSEGLAT